MEPSAAPRLLPRRSMLIRIGALVVAVPFARRFVSRPAVAQEATPEWTPPPIPQPLPEPGGTPPALVGAAPDNPAPPASGAPTSIEQPAAAGTPEAAPIGGGEQLAVSPQQPAQPMATPVGQEPVEQEPVVVVSLTPDFQFDPAEVRVKVGDAVEWRNDGRSPQTVTADPALVADESTITLPDGAAPFDSGVINFGETFAHVFDVAGDYAYVSLPQEANGMTGRVIVES